MGPEGLPTRTPFGPLWCVVSAGIWVHFCAPCGEGKPVEGLGIGARARHLGGVSALPARCLRATIADPHAAPWRRGLPSLARLMPWNRDSEQKKLPNMASLYLT